MNASSESGLWALTITRGSTDVIRNGMRLHPVYTTASEWPSQNGEKPYDKNEKGGHPTACEPGNFVHDHPNCASRARPAFMPWALWDPIAQTFRTALST